MKTIVFKIMPLCTLLMCLGSFWAGCGTANTAEDTETDYKIAEVNGKGITKQDLDNKIDDLKNTKKSYTLNGKSYKQVPDQATPEYEQFHKDVAADLVNDEVIYSEANKMGITANDDSGNDQLYKKVFEHVTTGVPEVTDAEVQAFYSSSNIRTFHVRHIVVADLATAQEVKAQLDAGADFASMAFEYSIDWVTWDVGGDVGDVPSSGSGLGIEFEKAMSQLAEGQISEPLEGGGTASQSTSNYWSRHSNGFEIIQVTSISSQIPSCANGACEEIPYTPTVPRNRDETYVEWLYKNKIPIYDAANGTKRHKNPYNHEFAQLWLDSTKRQLFSIRQKKAFQTWIDQVKTNYDINYSDPYNPAN